MSLAQAFATKHPHMRIVPRQIALDFTRKRPPRYPQPDDDGCYTLADIGEDIDLSVERARQIEILAMKKYRIAWQIQRLVGAKMAKRYWSALHRCQSYELFVEALASAQRLYASGCLVGNAVDDDDDSDEAENDNGGR